MTRDSNGDMVFTPDDPGYDPEYVGGGIGPYLETDEGCAYVIHKLDLMREHSMALIAGVTKA